MEREADDIRYRHKIPDLVRHDDDGTGTSHPTPVGSPSHGPLRSDRNPRENPALARLERAASLTNGGRAAGVSKARLGQD
ncbi:hypothetical protein GCM10009758_16380 [Microbacterium hatanonis]